MNQSSFIPFHKPSLGQDEIDQVAEVLRSDWLTSGPKTAQFEKDVARYVGAPHSLGVNSCTAAMHLALAALGVGPGDEVITTPLTFCATVNVILHVGATPVLADIGPDNNIDPESIRERITDRTRAIMPVHYGGLPCDMAAIWDIARHHNLWVIEDAAHAIGAHYRGYPVGAGFPPLNYASDAVAYSFYATKNLTTGEGGMLTSHDEAFIHQARVLCLHGISRDAWNRYSERGNWYYEVVTPGFKYNLTDIQSAIGIVQLQKQERLREIRAQHAAFYNHHLGGMEEFALPPDSPHCRHAWHLYSLRLNLDKLGITRGEFIEELRTRGIGSSVHFIPIPLHPFFAPYAGEPRNAVPRTMELFPRLVSLPLYPAMTPEDLDRVVTAVKQIASENRRMVAGIAGAREVIS